MRKFVASVAVGGCVWLPAAMSAESQDVKRMISETRAECWLEIAETPRSVIVYPKKSRHREEQGAVALEVIAREKWGAPKSAKVVGTTGFPLLDAEALRATKARRFRSNCPAEPFRYKVHFRMRE